MNPAPKPIVAAMQLLGFFPRPVNLQHSMLGINDRLVRTNTAVGPNKERIHRDTQHSAVSNDRIVKAQAWTPTNRLHTLTWRSCPNGHRDRDHTCHIQCNVNGPPLTAVALDIPVPPKYCRAPNARNWLYLSRILSDLDDSKCAGFPAGPKSERKPRFR